MDKSKCSCRKQQHKVMTWARTVSGELRHIDQAERGVTYYCPACGGEVFLRKGEERHPHYAHKHKGDRKACPYRLGAGGGESMRHAIAKQAVAQADEIAVPALFCEPHNESDYYIRSRKAPPILKIKEAATEATLKEIGVRLDVLVTLDRSDPATGRFCEANGDILGVEIKNKHQTGRRKKDLLDLMEIPAVEIDISEIDMSLGPEKIIEALTTHPERAEWIALRNEGILDTLKDWIYDLVKDRKVEYPDVYIRRGSICPDTGEPVEGPMQCKACMYKIEGSSKKEGQRTCICRIRKYFNQRFELAKKPDKQIERKKRKQQQYRINERLKDDSRETEKLAEPFDRLGELLRRYGEISPDGGTWNLETPEWRCSYESFDSEEKHEKYYRAETVIAENAENALLVKKTTRPLYPKDEMLPVVKGYRNTKRKYSSYSQEERAQVTRKADGRLKLLGEKLEKEDTEAWLKALIEEIENAAMARLRAFTVALKALLVLRRLWRIIEEKKRNGLRTGQAPIPALRYNATETGKSRDDANSIPYMGRPPPAGGWFFGRARRRACPGPPETLETGGLFFTQKTARRRYLTVSAVCRPLFFPALPAPQASTARADGTAGRTGRRTKP